MMKLNRTIAICALSLAGAYGCGSEATGDGNDSATGDDTSSGTDTGSGTVADAGPPVMDAPDAGDMISMDAGSMTEVDAGPPPPRCEGPSGGFGVQPGRNFAPFSGVTYCDGSPFDFYSEEDDYCDASVTVLVRAAEWCGPCRSKATEIGAGVLDEYGPLGVRFISVIDQNQTFDPPSQAACNNWESTFGLDNDRINHRMLMDPAQEVAVYFPPGQSGYPGSIIVSSDGQIIRRIIGSRPGMPDLKAALNELLGR